MTEKPSLQIIERVAERDDVDPAELRPRLYDVIDPEALDRLFSSRTDARDAPTGSVSFRYRGYRIVVTADGTVRVAEAESATSSKSATPAESTEGE